MNNLKDAPFAVAYIISIFAIIKFLKELPRPRWRFIILLVAALAFALSIRVGGILLFIYFVMFLVLNFFNENSWGGLKRKSVKQNAKKYLLMSAAICVAGYFLGLLPWPYGMIDPLSHPFEALTRQSDFSTTLQQTFEGEQIMSDNQPWYYLPKYIIITNPMVLFGGLISLLILLYPYWKKLSNKLHIGFVAFAAIFPLVYIIYKDANVYNAWRHVLFIYPPLVVLGGVGWELLYRHVEARKVLRYAVPGLFILLFAYPFQWMIRNHPHQVVYYNLPFGGVEQAYGNYELDYYMNGVKPALEWMHANGYFSGKEGKDLLVAGNPGTLTRYSDMYETENTELNYMKYRNRAKEKWDYAIFYTGFVDPFQLKQRIWPPKKTIHEVTVEGLPIVAVVKRTSFADYKGYQSFQRGEYQKAIANFRRYLEQDPQNEVVLSLTARAYNEKGDLQQAKKYFNKTLNVSPNSLSNLNQLGRIYMQNQEFQNAISIFQQMINVRNTYAPAYMNLGYAYAQTGNTQSAISYLEQAIQYNPRMKQAYQLLGQIYQQRGNQQQARRYFNQAKQL
jgi:tetratricopeptide (TPR) repeat protein